MEAHLGSSWGAASAAAAAAALASDYGRSREYGSEEKELGLHLGRLGLR